MLFDQVQNAVLATRSASQSKSLSAALSSGNVQVLADDYSLGERGIESGEIERGVSIANMDTLVDLLLEDGPKVVWH